MKTDYSQITETPGDRVTEEQVLRLYQRYFFARGFCQHKDVLEVACGGGAGLGLLADAARSVAAVDCDEKNLKLAQEIYADNNRIKIFPGDAHKLNFADCTFDVVVFYEAIYYLSQPEKFFAECKRILRPEGILIIGSANCEWCDFNPSAYSTRYFSASELFEIMQEKGFQMEMYKGFPIEENQSGMQQTLLSFSKRAAVKLHLIPKSMKYKKILKRLFVGKLVLLPQRLIPGSVEYLAPTPLIVGEETQFKVIYAVGHYQGR